MEGPRELQVEFHRAADRRRFHNRVPNPFLLPKENALARWVAAQMPRGGRYLLEIGCGERSNLYFLGSQLSGCRCVGATSPWNKSGCAYPVDSERPQG